MCLIAVDYKSVKLASIYSWSTFRVRYVMVTGISQSSVVCTPFLDISSCKVVFTDL